MWQHCQGTVWLLPRQSHVALVLPAISKGLGIIKECQRQIFKHLGSTLMSLFGHFHLCCRRASVETQCYLQQLKQPSRGALWRTSQGMKAPANSMTRPLPTLYQDSWEDITDLSAGSHHNLWFWASVEKGKLIVCLFTSLSGYRHTQSSYSLAICKIQVISPLI